MWAFSKRSSTRCAAQKLRNLVSRTNFHHEMSVNKKVSEENREFNFNWEDRYFFVINDGKTQCLVCLQVISVPKEFNVRRHYKTLNEKRYGQYQGTSIREAILKELKRNYFKQTGMLKSFTKCDSFAHLTASYDVALTPIFMT